MDCFAIFFQPSGFHALFGIPMTVLADQALEARSILGRGVEELEKQLAEIGDFEGRVRVAEDFIRRQAIRELPQDGVSAVALHILRSGGRGHVRDFAEWAGLSGRQLERRFLRQIGVVPKQFARIVRFDAALKAKLRCPVQSWADVAFQCGYYDQTHMISDFRLLASASPVQLIAELDHLPKGFIDSPPSDN